MAPSARSYYKMVCCMFATIFGLKRLYHIALLNQFFNRSVFEKLNIWMLL
ncbi:hypothetical protein MPC4_1210001 [Methylocella tundrae]|uniref:Uncharacterized protein n=1 Tax=Methylocella tundrae TaxID=227605 RepID=A0A8B6M2B0_METTU|nr:hypothetical protein MPC4_1210001 [Methylocella tundrae]